MLILSIVYSLTLQDLITFYTIDIDLDLWIYFPHALLCSPFYISGIWDIFYSTFGISSIEVLLVESSLIIFHFLPWKILLQGVQLQIGTLKLSFNCLLAPMLLLGISCQLSSVSPFFENNLAFFFSGCSTLVSLLSSEKVSAIASLSFPSRTLIKCIL